MRFLLFCISLFRCCNESGKQLLCRCILWQREFRMPMHRTDKAMRRHDNALDQSVLGNCRLMKEAAIYADDCTINPNIC